MRLKKGKKRFEVACYKNKVVEYRQGNEKDLDEVLQIHNVFLNVSKGQTAPSADLQKAFGKDMKLDDIILEILQKGDLQVGEKERHAQLEQIHNGVLDIVASRLVDPKSNRVYTTGMIDKALDMLSKKSAEEKAERAEAKKEGTGSGAATPGADGAAKKIEKPLWTGVVATKDAKSQALLAMKALIAWQPIPVIRARMRVRITCHPSILKQSAKPAPRKSDDPEAAPEAKGTVKDRLLSYMEEIEDQDDRGGEWECRGFIEPGAYKPLGEFVAGETKGRARVEVLDMAVTHEND